METLRRKKEAKEQQERHKKLVEFAKAYGVDPTQLDNMVKRIVDQTKISEEMREQAEGRFRRGLPFTQEHQVPPTFEPEEFRWKCGDGRVIPVTQLEDDHLRNAICWVSRRLVMKIGTTTWLESIIYEAEAFAQVLHEAKRRGIRV